MEETAIAGKITAKFQELGMHLALWLEKTLGSEQEHWWNTSVLSALSPVQLQRIAKHRITSLQQLDLAALVRVLDQNWFPLSQKCQFGFEERNYVKEMGMVRNRWAHASIQGIERDVIFRDLDTIQRFATMLEVDDDFISGIKTMKTTIFPVLPPASAPVIPEERTNQETPLTLPAPVPVPGFSPGQLVSLKSDPARQGPIIKMPGTAPDSPCVVFLDGKRQQFYLDQIQLVVDSKPNIVSIEELHTLLTGLQILHPSTAFLYSLHSARIDFVPYQFRPALKLIHSDRPRILIADGVGVGKTIEAGLIMRELQARSNLESVLIICPKPLITEKKWEQEMKRFDERFMPLNGDKLRYCLDETDKDGEWPDNYQKTIIPYSLFDEVLVHGSKDGRKRQKGLLDLDPFPRFDLVIVDEAHHIRNSSTYAHKAVRLFCDHAKAVVLLTATPVQLGNQDLFSLLNVLRPDLIIDEASFQRMVEANPFINDALKQARGGGSDWQQAARDALEKAAATDWGKAVLAENPEFAKARQILQETTLSREDRVAMIQTLENFHSLSRLINRTRRKDIGAFCLRKSETIEIPFSPQHREIHDELLEFEAKTLAAVHGGQNVRFMMSTLRRQAASCIFGLVPFLGTILARRLNDLENLEIDDSEEADFSGLEMMKAEAEILMEKARGLPPDDPKFEALWTIVQQKELLPNNKIMVFSSFRHTLAYLKTLLEEKQVRVGLVQGETPDEMRVTLRDRFMLARENPEALDVLLFSEVGCEGLDYQFCDVMVNYDIPWNPMRIEQRIGRIDRRGQKSETVAIYNLITPDTIDSDIFQRCLRRIGIFEESIGECEEILGELHQEIRKIALNLELTAEERQKKLEQLADNEIRKMQEMKALEEREYELFGIQLPKFQAEKEIQQAESFWLTPAALQRVVTQYLEKRLNKSESILGEKPLKTLRLSEESRKILWADFQHTGCRKTLISREWEKWLKGADQHKTITFDAACAAETGDTTFITPIHPLVLQAVKFQKFADPAYTVVQVAGTDLPKGDHKFAIYSWEEKGIKPGLRFVPIAADEAIREALFSFLESGVSIPSDSSIPDTDQFFADLDKTHHAIWEKARVEHQHRTQEICRYRRETLSTSIETQIQNASQLLAQNNDPKIQKMREAQVAKLKSDLHQKMQEIHLAESTSDIHAHPIAFGILKIEN